MSLKSSGNSSRANVDTCELVNYSLSASPLGKVRTLSIREVVVSGLTRVVYARNPGPGPMAFARRKRFRGEVIGDRQRKETRVYQSSESPKDLAAAYYSRTVRQRKLW